MQRIVLALKQGLHKKIVAVSLLILTISCSLFIFAQQPSYAATSSQGKLTQDEKIDRAYQFSEATGLLEEDKQASPAANEPFNYNEKANEKTVTASQEEKPASGLIEKAKEFVDKVIVND